MPKQKTVHVIVSGRVQGVCFRMETKRAAMEKNVRGWVKNRSDGSVEGVFEGAEAEVDALVNWCRRGPRMAMVTDVRVQDADYGGFEDFAIR